MNHGRVEQVGSPTEVYENPATPFVMSFVGPVNVLPIDLPDQLIAAKESLNSQAFLRPHDIDISVSPESGGVSATVQRLIHVGWTIRVELLLANRHPIIAHINREQFKTLNLQSQQTVFLNPKNIRTFETYAGEARTDVA